MYEILQELDGNFVLVMNLFPAWRDISNRRKGVLTWYQTLRWAFRKQGEGEVFWTSFNFDVMLNKRVVGLYKV